MMTSNFKRSNSNKDDLLKTLEHDLKQLTDLEIDKLKKQRENVYMSAQKKDPKKINEKDIKLAEQKVSVLSKLDLSINNDEDKELIRQLNRATWYIKQHKRKIDVENRLVSLFSMPQFHCEPPGYPYSIDTRFNIFIDNMPKDLSAASDFVSVQDELLDKIVELSTKRCSIVNPKLDKLGSLLRAQDAFDEQKSNEVLKIKKEINDSGREYISLLEKSLDTIIQAEVKGALTKLIDGAKTIPEAQKPPTLDNDIELLENIKKQELISIDLLHSEVQNLSCFDLSPIMSKFHLRNNICNRSRTYENNLGHFITESERIYSERTKSASVNDNNMSASNESVLANTTTEYSLADVSEGGTDAQKDVQTDSSQSSCESERNEDTDRSIANEAPNDNNDNKDLLTNLTKEYKGRIIREEHYKNPFKMGFSATEKLGVAEKLKQGDLSKLSTKEQKIANQGRMKEVYKALIAQAQAQAQDKDKQTNENSESTGPSHRYAQKPL